MMYLSGGLFGTQLFGTLWASWTCVSLPFTSLWKFLAIISSNRFSISCSLSTPSGFPMMWMLLCFVLSQRFLKLSSFKKIFFLFAALPGCFFLHFLANHWFGTLLHLPTVYSFQYVIYFRYCIFFWLFSCFYVFFMLLSILLIIPLNSLSDKLLAFIPSSSSGVLSCFFIWGLFLCLPILVASLYFLH